MSYLTRPLRCKAFARRPARTCGAFWPARGLVALALTLFVSPATAQAGRVLDLPAVKVDLGGDVKGFLDLSVPYEHLLMPEEPQVSGALDFRLKFEGKHRSWLSWSVHHSLTARLQPAGSALALGQETFGRVAEEALPLSYQAVDTENFKLDGRVDRLLLTLHIPGLNATVGRQPLSFGTGLFFTPLDLLAPYSPQVIDREYKPGVDALRLDGFIGATGRITLALGSLGSRDLGGLFALGYGGFTLGITDLNFFLAKLREDVVLGASLATSVGPIGLHADLSLTVPYGGEERCPGAAFEADENERCPPFIRAVVGADARTNFGLTAMAEIYVQTTGSDDSSAYLKVASRERFLQGELWTMGTLYTAISLNQEILPILGVSLVGVINLLDPSALLGPGLTWSVASNAELSLGGFIALGERPEEVDPLDLFNAETGEFLSEQEALEVIKSTSEFGLMPGQAYAQMKFYF